MNSDSSNIPANHPRAHSLRVRERMKDAVAAGLVHPTGLIAHGRGEAFDYLLGETTPPEAVEAIQEAARLLALARQPVLSLNGNVVALAAGQCLEVARAWPAIRLEVNLFHRTPERIARLIGSMEQEGAPKGSILGASPDFRIPGLASDRALCSKAGIGGADVVLVPLEDGDRCQALRAMGKTVITIDLNPLSRTARAAHVTIVDELTRALPLLTGHLAGHGSPAGSHAGSPTGASPPGAAPPDSGKGPIPAPQGPAYDNHDILARVRARMAAVLASST